jgi:hypothetical protein
MPRKKIRGARGQHGQGQASPSVKEKKRSLLERKEARKSGVLGDAPQENVFILCNGRPVKNVRELADALGEIGEDVFRHHVNPEKNDFATWVKDIFRDEELAQQLAGTKDQQHTRIVMYRHLVDKLKKK